MSAVVALLLGLSVSADAADCSEAVIAHVADIKVLFSDFSWKNTAFYDFATEKNYAENMAWCSNNDCGVGSESWISWHSGFHRMSKKLNPRIHSLVCTPKGREGHQMFSFHFDYTWETRDDCVARFGGVAIGRMNTSTGQILGHYSHSTYGWEQVESCVSAFQPHAIRHRELAALVEAWGDAINRGDYLATAYMDEDATAISVGDDVNVVKSYADATSQWLEALPGFKFRVSRESPMYFLGMSVAAVYSLHAWGLRSDGLECDVWVRAIYFFHIKEQTDGTFKIKKTEIVSNHTRGEVIASLSCTAAEPRDPNFAAQIEKNHKTALLTIDATEDVINSGGDEQVFDRLLSHNSESVKILDGTWFTDPHVAPDDVQPHVGKEAYRDFLQGFADTSDSIRITREPRYGLDSAIAWTESFSISMKTGCESTVAALCRQDYNGRGEVAVQMCYYQDPNKFIQEAFCGAYITGSMGSGAEFGAESGAESGAETDAGRSKDDL